MIGDLYKDEDGKFWIEIDLYGESAEMQSVFDVSKECHLPKYTVWSEGDEVRCDFLPQDLKKIGKDYVLAKDGDSYGFRYVYYRRADIERIFMSRIKNIENNIELKKFLQMYSGLINYWATK